MNLKTSILSLIFAFSASFMFSQEDTVRYEDVVYVDFIKSVAFHQRGLPTSYPVIKLGARLDKLKLSFDDMGGSFYDYRYEVKHCNKDWEPSKLDELEYIDGFNGERIEQFTTGENTFVDYTNYELIFPNEDIDFTISGNYLLIIYDEAGLPIITRRFIVVNPKVKISAELRKCPEIEFINSYQGISFEAINSIATISNPKEEIYASVIQNGKWHDAENNLQPTAIVGDRIRFNNNRPISFPGLKEHRNFDIRTLEAATRNVHSIDLEINSTKAILELAQSRYFGNYSFENDGNGSFVIENSDSNINMNDNGHFDNDDDEDWITSDYVDVYFTLKTMEIYDRDVYVVGKFNDWTPSEDYLMTYEHDRNVYTGNFLFKQGYYDYFYAAVDGEGNMTTDLLEGNSFQTENDYMIVIYQRSYSENYDEVVGLRYLNTASR